MCVCMVVCMYDHVVKLMPVSPAEIHPTNEPLPGCLLFRVRISHEARIITTTTARLLGWDSGDGWMPAARSLIAVGACAAIN